MKERDYLVEMRAVLAAQRRLIGSSSESIDRLEDVFRKAEGHANEIEDLGKILDELEQDRESLVGVKELTDWDDTELEAVISHRKEQFSLGLKSLEYKTWPQFVRDSQIYCLSSGVEHTLPWEAMLTEENLQQLKNEDYGNQYQWDKWDYAFVGAAGVLASLTDFFLVKIPQDMNYLGKFDQEGSPITKWLKETINSEEGTNNWFANWARDLEGRCKVAYDAANFAQGGLNGSGGRTHRFQSLGHDPILGFIFGVLDIYRGTLTEFSYDKFTGNHSFDRVVTSGENSISLIESILLHIGHLISDVGTKHGLPAPFMGLFQALNIRSPFSPKGRTVGQIARWMYLSGYDLRHFITMGITPAVIEIVLRAYIMIRHYSEHGETKFLIGDNPKYRSMLLSAHAIACAGNAGKIALYQGNPLAINYAEWLALIRDLIPSLKYWLFDKTKLKLQHYNSINDRGWEELTTSGVALLEKVYMSDMPVISLGQYASPNFSRTT
jgi:hypothetical protein